MFSLMAPIAKDQYAWSSQDTTLYVNIILAGIAIMCVVGFVASKHVAQW